MDLRLLCILGILQITHIEPEIIGSIDNGKAYGKIEDGHDPPGGRIVQFLDPIIVMFQIVLLVLSCIDRLLVMILLFHCYDVFDSSWSFSINMDSLISFISAEGLRMVRIKMMKKRTINRSRPITYMI